MILGPGMHPRDLYAIGLVLPPWLAACRQAGRDKTARRIATAPPREARAYASFRYHQGRINDCMFHIVTGTVTDLIWERWATNLGGWHTALETVCAENLALPSDLGWPAALYPWPTPELNDWAMRVYDDDGWWDRYSARYTDGRGIRFDDPAHCPERHGADLIIPCRHDRNPCTPAEKLTCEQCGPCTWCTGLRSA